MGNRTSSAEQVKYVGNTDVCYFGFYFMSPKWTRTKIVIGITLLLQAEFCLLLVHMGYGFLRIYPELLIAIRLLLSHIVMRILFIMFSSAYFIFKLLKCEAANFSRSSLACMNGRQINILWHILCT